MPVSKKKPTTPTSEVSTQESSSPTLPEQEEFRQYSRRLAVSAVQVLIEQVMREELEQCIGASWGECTPHRRGYRNGSYTRDLVTSTGCIEDLEVPRDREGAFHSQVFERYIRSTNAIESLWSLVRQRTDQIDAFPTETSCLTIVWAVMQDIRFPKIPVG
jgi:transposase-like protein